MLLYGGQALLQYRPQRQMRRLAWNSEGNPRQPGQAVSRHSGGCEGQPARIEP